jgi:transposase
MESRVLRRLDESRFCGRRLFHELFLEIFSRNRKTKKPLACAARISGMSTDAAPSAAAPDNALPADAPALQALVRHLQARESEHQSREAQLVAALNESSQTVTQQQQLLDKLTHEMALMKRWMFGSRRERFDADDPRQKSLFEVSEPGSDAPSKDESRDDESVDGQKKKKRRGHGRRPLPEFLPRQRVEHIINGPELNCPGCGQERQKISEVASEQLEYVPASLFVIEHVQITYACAPCQEHVVTADKPRQPIEKGIPGPGLLAHIIAAKYARHMPLYRQEEDLARYGVLIRRSTLAGWMAGAAECLLPLYELMKRWVLASDILGTDDTPVKVLDPELDHTRTGRFWAYVGDDRHRETVYDYTPSRKRDGPKTFLKDYAGVLQADAFSGYDGIYYGSNGKIVEAACGAHARRKFYEARETSPEVAHQGLAFFGRLYAIEHDAELFAPEARYALRQQKSVPILDELKTWLNETLVKLRPKTPVAGALKYCLKNWDALCRFTTDGNIPIDNNRTERTLRAQAIGRRNWTFLGSDNGGRTAAVLYSFVASAKRHHLDVEAYLTDVLRRLPAVVNPLALRDLLPERWAKSHPECVLQFRRTESAQAAQRRRLSRRERRRQQAQAKQ